MRLISMNIHKTVRLAITRLICLSDNLYMEVKKEHLHKTQLHFSFVVRYIY